jgi:hypothetical protein
LRIRGVLPDKLPPAVDLLDCADVDAEAYATEDIKFDGKVDKILVQDISGDVIALVDAVAVIERKVCELIGASEVVRLKTIVTVLLGPDPS